MSSIMFKNLAFLFLFSASVQAMPKGGQESQESSGQKGFEKKEEWAEEIEKQIEEVSHLPAKHQLQEALQTIFKGPPGKEQKVESGELSEAMVNATIDGLGEAAKAKQQEVEMLKAELDESTKLFEQVTEKGQKI